MHPPFSFAGLRENWTSFSPSSDAVAAKHRAVLQYRTQLNLGRKFLLSFIRRSELFGFFSPTQVHGVPQGAVFVDGSVGEWPKGVGYLPDPVRDTITRNVERGADVRSVAVCADPGYLFVRLEMYGRVADEARYTVRLASCHEDSRRINMRLVAPDRVVVRQAHKWVASKDIICRSSGNKFELAIPRILIGTSDRVILGVETRYRQIMVDRTAWTLLVLPSQSESEGATLFSTASESDLAEVADVFVGAFEKEVKNTLGENPQYDVVQHLFELMHRAEPQALFVARNAKGIVGYVYAPSSLQKVWHTALVEGHLWRWFTNWIRGRYPIRLTAARTLLLDKYFLVRSSLRDRSRSQHRILSVGVKPEAQGEGIASRLVQQAITRFERMGAPSIRLEVRPQNKAALRVYEKLGFVVRSSMYDSRGEWWVMTKELSTHTDDASKPLDPAKRT
jgi:ribosomal protein S18 acetylase RimI-like enzyme